MTIRTALVTLLAIALFAWFLSRANLSAVLTEIAHAQVGLIAWSIVIAAVMPVMRAIRWRYLLDPIGPTRFGPVLKATIVGFAALALLPARAGDVIRPYLVARSEGLSAASVFATVVMERALDLIVVLTLMASFVWLFDGRAILPASLVAGIQASATLAAAAVIALMAVMWTLATHPERIQRLVARTDRVLPHRVAHTLAVLQHRGIPTRIVKAGDRLSAGDVTMEVLHPPPAGPDGNENARSLVLEVRHAGHTLLLTGDLEGSGLERVLALPPRKVDVLMAPHHGSRKANTPDFASWARPQVVVSCQGPPRSPADAAEPYKARGAQFLGTWPHGAVTVHSHSSGMVVETFVTKQRFVVRGRQTGPPRGEP